MPGTTFSEVLTNYAMNFIQDERWAEQLATNPAVFYRSKSDVLRLAIPRFNHPPTMTAYLAYSEPSYDSYSFPVNDDVFPPLALNTGMTGYELCCVGVTEATSDGSFEYTPIRDFTYDAETGEVTVNVEILPGQTVEVDFYTDGVFENVLNDAEKRILGLCVAYDWFYKFSNAFLNVLNPIADKSFSPKSAPAEDKRSNTARLIDIRNQLADEMRSYEEQLYALKFVPKSKFQGLIR